MTAEAGPPAPDRGGLPFDGRVQVFGIRHHGPGSARSVRRALERWQPDAVLVELPAECDPILHWVGDAGLVPPVAILGHVLDQPQRAAFVPLAEFSPEWQALRWAAELGVAVQAIDLPLAVTLADGTLGDGPPALDDDLRCARSNDSDPLASLAAAAGDPDPERWWDDVVEQRGDGAAAFDTVAEAMSAVRDGWQPHSAEEAAREAYMRQCIRGALASGRERVAVVCGAWHVPALVNDGPGRRVDTLTVRAASRSKVKVAVSWVPWTHRRLARSTGYGAGVQSPGWYRHLFRHPGEDGVTRWFIDAARLLRAEGLPASPDHLIAGARAAAALSALRGRPRPGLAEVLDAMESVMAASTGLAAVERELLVGDAIGAVPDGAPQVPLARDLAQQQRRVRLRPQEVAHTLELDLRTPSGRGRSVLLHRLVAIGVPWGEQHEGRGSSGTFRETWLLQWEPELSVRVIECAAHGTTVESAAVNALLERAATATSLASLVAVLDLAVLADLTQVVQPVVRRVEVVAATDPDVAQVIDALGPMARTLRYGDVRGSDASALRAVFDGLVVRVLSGVVLACRSLDDVAAAMMVERLTEVQAALALTDHAARAHEWPAVLTLIAERHDVHGLLQGRAVRLLHDGGIWRRAQLAGRLSRALSIGTPPVAGAAFVEGFVAGSGTVLVHDRELLDVIDGWMAGLGPEEFITTAPLLRRTFAAFTPAERRQLGLLVADVATGPQPLFGPDVDGARAAAGLHTVRLLLGVST